MKKLVVLKHSKYEWERKKFGLTHDELISKYSKEYANVDAILEAHDHQINIRCSATGYLNNATFKMLDEINSPVNTKFDLVIVFGGDNSFTKVSHYIADTPIIGVNSDPHRSNGCMLKWAMYSEEDVIKFSEMLDLHQYDIEKWCRLSATLDGTPITSATSEYFFGERLRNRMSRHVLVYDEMTEEQKCSGIIIATGAGSTGWFNSANNISKGYTWHPTKTFAHFLITEPYSGSMFFGSVRPEKPLIIRSLNDDDGMVGVDSWQEFPFIRGSEIVVKTSECPLNVLSPIGK